MSAVERLEAAIEKLETLRARSTQPTGGRAWLQGRPNRRYENANEVYTGEESFESEDIAHGLPKAEDAELIVTLHSTIDAQLAILRSAVQVRSEQNWEEFGFNVIDPNMDALADAILGGAS